MNSGPRSLVLVFILVVSTLLLLPATQTHAASQIRITEIMYDPLGDGSKEFVEIYNGSDTTADLGGWSFQAGVDFTFPGGSSLGSGKYGVVVRDKPIFQSSYPNARVLGQYGGKLVGRGELVKLVDKNGGLVTQVDYRSGGGWPTLPRNGGPSLSLTSPTADETLPSCWGSSTVAGGSPGFTNSATGGGSSCKNKAYPVTPPPPQTPSSGGSSSSGGGSGSTGSTNKSNQPPAETPSDGSSGGDKKLENLTPEQKKVLEQESQQEVKEDAQPELAITERAGSEPHLKRLAGITMGSLVVLAGAIYFAIDRVAKSKGKYFAGARVLLNKHSWLKTKLRIK